MVRCFADCKYNLNYTCIIKPVIDTRGKCKSFTPKDLDTVRPLLRKIQDGVEDE